MEMEPEPTPCMAADEKDKQKHPEPSKRDEDPVGKVYDSKLMRRLGHYVRPYWVQATISSLAVSLKSLSDVTGPYLVKVAIDRYLTGTPGPATNWLTRRLPADPYHGITVLATIFMGALLSAYLFEFIQTYMMQWVGQKIMFDLRRDIFRHMQRMHIGFFDNHAVGRLVTRLTSDVDAINEMFTAGVLAIVDDFFNLTIMAIVMLTINWWLALIAFAAVPESCAGELSPRARRHCPHKQLYAGTRIGHGRGAAIQPRAEGLQGF
jgi:ATP-binding cassette subfamily B protein